MILSCGQPKGSQHQFSSDLTTNTVYGKFYVYSLNGNDTMVDILYYSFEYDGDTIWEKEYDAAMDLVNVRSLAVVGDRWLLKEKYSRRYRGVMDSAFVQYDYEVIDDVAFDWSGSHVSSLRKIEFPGGMTLIEDEQLLAIDTLVLGHAAKVFEGRRSIQTLYNGDTTKQSGVWYRTYTSKLGMTNSQLSYEGGNSFVYELDRTLTQVQWDSILTSIPNRVAYLQATDEEDFSTCGVQRSICDYYNDERARILQPRTQVLNQLDSIIQKVDIKDETAIVVAHYVVNCEGEVGRHSIEAYDSDYLSLPVSVDLSTTVTNYLKEQLTYRPLKIRGEERDCYAYTLIKLSDGQVTDILP